MSRFVRTLALIAAAVTACLALSVFCDCHALADAGQEAALRVRIRLAREPKDNVPYTTAGTEYDRGFFVPQIAGSRGYVIKQTSDVSTYLFSVAAADGVADLTLDFDQLPDMISVSLNKTPLTTGEAVTVDLNDIADLRVSTAKKRAVIRLAFTTLPVVSVRTSGTISKYRTTGCALTLIDPEYRLHGWQDAVLDTDAVISLRGLSSSHYSEKHPYNFSIMKDGKKLDKSLLGLRTDSDWILDSAFSDASRMRNRVLMDLWDELYRLPWNRALSGGTKGRYVELFMNGTYRGLFVLSEKQDRSQLGLARQGGKYNSLLLKTRQGRLDNNSPAGFLSLSGERPEDDEPLTWYNVEVRYPTENITDYRALWEDYYDFTRLVIRGSDEEFARDIEKYVDLDNLAVYWLFINGGDMSDNMVKNMTFARYDDRDPRFDRFILLPWDMDASLGRQYSSRKSAVEGTMSNRLFLRLIRGNVSGFCGRLQAKWAEMRQSVMTVDHIMSLFDGYYSVIRTSGADRREITAHPRFTSYLKGGFGFRLDFERELSYIRTYMEKRLAYMDSYIAGLGAE